MAAKGFKSKFEIQVAEELKRNGVKFIYESEGIPFTRQCVYHPDFLIGKRIFIESKGQFDAADRGKHLLLREQNPDLDIRFVFMNSRVRLNKTSRTTYGDWATKHGFLWSERTIPKEWIEEALKQQELNE